MDTAPASATDLFNSTMGKRRGISRRPQRLLSSRARSRMLSHARPVPARSANARLDRANATWQACSECFTVGMEAEAFVVKRTRAFALLLTIAPVIIALAAYPLAFVPVAAVAGVFWHAVGRELGHRVVLSCPKCSCASPSTKP